MGNAKICASVSQKTPLRYSYVTVYGTLKVGSSFKTGKTMKAVWQYKTTTSSCSGVTNSAGVGQCQRYIAGATKGYKVYVKITIGGYSVNTFFTPK